MQLAEKGSFVGEEVWHKRRDGTVFPTLMTGTLMSDQNWEASVSINNSD